MSAANVKSDLHRYLRVAREALLWKLERLSEYDVRRPLVPTGTNLLGLVKHLASVEAGYFGVTFGRPFDEPMPWRGPDQVDTTLHRILVHVVAETNRHVGHADIVRELIDGNENMAPVDQAWWEGQRARLERVARQFS
jgi:uncharacterized damage-inducible protein DinB